MDESTPRVGLNPSMHAVGRSRELAEIERVLRAIDELPAAISLVGEPGYETVDILLEQGDFRD